MADVKWIKIVTDIFDDEKILLIESMPEHDAIIVIWFKLLCLAGKMNNSGVFMMNDKIAYTEEMLATIFRRPLNTVRLALNTFEGFGMIERVDNVITIPNWSKHQTLDQLEERKEYMRNYMQKYRQKQKKIAGGNKVPENGLPLSDWKKVINYFNNECAYCGDKNTELEQEHVIPVNLGGKYEMGNIIPACRRCNSSKNNSDMHEWYKRQNFFNNDRLDKIVNFCKVYNVNLRKANVNSLDIDIEEDKDIDIKSRAKSKRFVPPSIEEVKEYCKQRNNKVDPEQFINFYESKGWMVGKNKMKDWKAAVRTWEKRENSTTQPKKQQSTNKFNNFPQREYTATDYKAIERALINKGLED